MGLENQEQLHGLSQSANKSVALFADRDTYSNEDKCELGDSTLGNTWNMRDAIWALSLKDADTSDDSLWKKLKKQCRLQPTAISKELAATMETRNRGSDAGLDRERDPESDVLPLTSSQAAAANIDLSSMEVRLSVMIPEDWAMWVTALSVDDDKELERIIQHWSQKDRATGRSAQNQEVMKALAKNDVGLN